MLESAPVLHPGGLLDEKSYKFMDGVHIAAWLSQRRWLGTGKESRNSAPTYKGRSG
jgi:hypothetical protein